MKKLIAILMAVFVMGAAFAGEIKYPDGNIILKYPDQVTEFYEEHEDTWYVAALSKERIKIWDEVQKNEREGKYTLKGPHNIFSIMSYTIEHMTDSLVRLANDWGKVEFWEKNTEYGYWTVKVIYKTYAGGKVVYQMYSFYVNMPE